MKATRMRMAYGSEMVKLSLDPQPAPVTLRRCSVAWRTDSHKGACKMEDQLFNLDSLSEQILAVGALGTAAFGLVDGSKAFRGGISNVGFRFIDAALTPFASSLDVALGKNVPGCDWRAVMRSHWINGRAKDEQKAIAVALIQLGLTSDTYSEVAKGGNVDAPALKGVVDALASGQPMTEVQLNLLGRLKATVEARIDAAYERADQAYRSWARLAAGIVAILLALLANHLFVDGATEKALVVGLLAVPLAPIAKDVASALSKAVHAIGRRSAP